MSQRKPKAEIAKALALSMPMSFEGAIRTVLSILKENQHLLSFTLMDVQKKDVQISCSESKGNESKSKNRE